MPSSSLVEVGVEFGLMLRLGLMLGLRLGCRSRFGGSGFGLGLLFRSGGWGGWVGGWLEIWRLRLISTQVVVEVEI